MEDGYRRINPQMAVPVLELDDGTVLSESVAICCYLEEIEPEPALSGSGAKGKAMVEMWHRRMELDGLQAMAEAVRNSVKFFAGRAIAGPVDFAQIFLRRTRRDCVEFSTRRLSIARGDNGITPRPICRSLRVDRSQTLDDARFVKLGALPISLRPHDPGNPDWSNIRTECNQGGPDGPELPRFGRELGASVTYSGVLNEQIECSLQALKHAVRNPFAETLVDIVPDIDEVIDGSGSQSIGLRHSPP
jgi:hypothetical protein